MFSWDYIGSVVGAGAVTAVIVQVIKKIVGHEVNTWWLRLIVFVIGTALLTVGRAITAGLTWDGLLLCVINGVAVFFSATGEYHTIKDLFPTEESSE